MGVRADGRWGAGRAVIDGGNFISRSGCVLVAVDSRLLATSFERPKVIGTFD